MNTYRKFLAATFAAVVVSASAFAADVSPTGTWKWTAMRRGGGQGFEVTLKLEEKEGQLTGTVLGRETPNGNIPDTPITDASFKDGVVKFSVTREMGERKWTTKYEGKLEGDTIKGSSERPNREGGITKDEWTATRAK